MFLNIKLFNLYIIIYIKGNKLSLNNSKCFVMHLGPRCEVSPQIRVQDKLMKKTIAEKYYTCESCNLLNNNSSVEEKELYEKL